MTSKVAVVAVGGNSLIKDPKRQTVPDQRDAAAETCVHIASMIERGWHVVLTHGNGPQVGFILRRSELSMHELHEVPLDACGADSQGALGYMLQQLLYNEFQRRGIQKRAVTVVTQVLVDRDDPAFKRPTKPIGSFMDEATARQRHEQLGWDIMEDAGRGWRRVIASPIPQKILEQEAIQTLIEKDFLVIGVGGGGIPVVQDAEGNLIGAAAVIDKDHASSLLAGGIGADLFVISTGVEQVALNFGKPNQVNVSRMTVAEAKQYIAEGHFKPGSMLPKIQAAIAFLEKGGKQALITNPQNIERALDGKTGTLIVP